MDFHSLKRKELQALCKKHGLPANKTNIQMADSLTLTLKVNDKPISGEDRELVKRKKEVRFSPDDEIREYEPSVYRIGGRRTRRTSLANPELKEIGTSNPSNNGSGKKRGRPSEKVGNVGRVTRSQAKVNKEISNSLIESELKRIGRNGLKQKSKEPHSVRRSKRNVGNLVDAEFIEVEVVGKIRRSQRQSVKNDRVIGGENEFIGVMDESSKGLGRNGSRRKSFACINDKVGKDGEKVFTEDRKRLRNTDLKVANEVKATLQTREDIEKASLPAAGLRRSRRKTAVLNSSSVTVEERTGKVVLAGKVKQLNKEVSGREASLTNEVRRRSTRRSSVAITDKMNEVAARLGRRKRKFEHEAIHETETSMVLDKPLVGQPPRLSTRFASESVEKKQKSSLNMPIVIKETTFSKTSQSEDSGSVMTDVKSLGKKGEAKSKSTGKSNIALQSDTGEQIGIVTDSEQTLFAIPIKLASASTEETSTVANNNLVVYEKNIDLKDDRGKSISNDCIDGGADDQSSRTFDSSANLVGNNSAEIKFARVQEKTCDVVLLFDGFLSANPPAFAGESFNSLESEKESAIEEIIKGKNGHDGTNGIINHSTEVDCVSIQGDGVHDLNRTEQDNTTEEIEQKIVHDNGSSLPAVRTDIVTKSTKDVFLESDGDVSSTAVGKIHGQGDGVDTLKKTEHDDTTDKLQYEAVPCTGKASLFTSENSVIQFVDEEGNASDAAELPRTSFANEHQCGKATYLFTPEVEDTNEYQNFSTTSVDLKSLHIGCTTSKDNCERQQDENTGMANSNCEVEKNVLEEALVDHSPQFNLEEVQDRKESNTAITKNYNDDVFCQQGFVDCMAGRKEVNFDSNGGQPFSMEASSEPIIQEQPSEKESAVEGKWSINSIKEVVNRSGKVVEGQLNADQREEVVREGNAECSWVTKLSDHDGSEEVVRKVNGSVDEILSQTTCQENEISSGKNVELIAKSSVSIKRIDRREEKEKSCEKRDLKVITSEYFIVEHLEDKRVPESCDGLCENDEVADEETRTVTMSIQAAIDEVAGGMQSNSTAVPGKTVSNFGDELLNIKDSSLVALDELASTNFRSIDKTYSGAVDTESQFEGKAVYVDSLREKYVMESGTGDFIDLNADVKAAHTRVNFGRKDDIFEVKDINSDAEKEFENTFFSYREVTSFKIQSESAMFTKRESNLIQGNGEQQGRFAESDEYTLDDNSGSKDSDQIMHAEQGVVEKSEGENLGAKDFERNVPVEDITNIEKAGKVAEMNFVEVFRSVTDEPIFGDRFNEVCSAKQHFVYLQNHGDKRVDNSLSAAREGICEDAPKVNDKKNDDLDKCIAKRSPDNNISSSGFQSISENGAYSEDKEVCTATCGDIDKQEDVQVREAALSVFSDDASHDSYCGKTEIASGGFITQQNTNGSYEEVKDQVMEDGGTINGENGRNQMACEDLHDPIDSLSPRNSVGDHQDVAKEQLNVHQGISDNGAYAEGRKVCPATPGEFDELEEVGTVGETALSVFSDDTSHETVGSILSSCSKWEGSRPAEILLFADNFCGKPEFVSGTSFTQKNSQAFHEFEDQEHKEILLTEKSGTQIACEDLKYPADGSSLGNKVRNHQEAVKDQLNVHQDIETALTDDHDSVILNKLLRDNKNMIHSAEGGEAHCLNELEDELPSVTDSKKAANFESPDAISPFKNEPVVDSKTISAVRASSYKENEALELNLFFGMGEEYDIEEPREQASQVNLTSEEARESPEKIMIIDSPAKQVAEDQHGECEDQIEGHYLPNSDEANFDKAKEPQIQASVSNVFDDMQDFIFSGFQENRSDKTESNANFIVENEGEATELTDVLPKTCQTALDQSSGVCQEELEDQMLKDQEIIAGENDGALIAFENLNDSTDGRSLDNNARNHQEDAKEQLNDCQASGADLMDVHDCLTLRKLFPNFEDLNAIPTKNEAVADCKIISASSGSPLNENEAFEYEEKQSEQAPQINLISKDAGVLPGNAIFIESSATQVIEDKQTEPEYLMEVSNLAENNFEQDKDLQENEPVEVKENAFHDTVLFEQTLDCDPSNLKEDLIANLIGESEEEMKLVKDVPEIGETKVDHQSAVLSSGVGQDFTAGDGKSCQGMFQSAKKASPLRNLTGFIQGTPQKVFDSCAINENALSMKKVQVGSLTAPKTLIKRRPLEDISKK
ncbi:uncharacterized protein LOC105640927 isoform X3 [Jatropha curcas]|uniref:uncharacterized protein LOC105640927 isoform X3 n=1 Tax=Jatropha curcas TaxID=180498 RepID=UPI0005FAB9FD|nr:uncharacterized protein LOC105640927 isoform X3 [Jatropha curcas]